MTKLKGEASKQGEYLPIMALLIIVILQLISHQMHTPLWLSGFVLVLISFKFISLKSRVAKAPFLLRIVLIVSSSATFIAYYKTNFSVDMAASFLLLACTLKLLELEKHKDVKVFVFSMIYLSAVSFLFEQGLFQALLQVLTISICLYCLLMLQVCSTTSKNENVKLFKSYSKSMFKIVMISIPFVAFLFLFFPRISPLWQMPLKTQASKTGISDEMSPGDVSELAKSSDPAFRVRFDSGVPSKANLYWRGLILDSFDGRKWTSATKNNWTKTYKVDPGFLYETSEPSYQVMLEPNQQKWVFSLDGSYPSSSNLIKSDMGLYRLKTEAIQATRYKLYIDSEYKGRKISEIPSAHSVSSAERISSYQRQDLQLPNNQSNPKTQKYINQLKDRLPTDKKILSYLLNNFREDIFYYTLEPPELGDNFVDEFIFDSKSGFCGHYAGSLAYMLRLADIPARVVIGYQGGELNSQSNYMIVSQFDAHAWVEAFIEGEGWLRIDPTAMVSPLRISEGSSTALGNEQAFMEGSPFASAAMRFGIVNWLRLRLDELNYQWQNVVVNYNQDQQQSFFKKALGENSLLRVALVFVYASITLFILMLVYLWLKKLSGYSPAEKRYIIWLSFVAKFGLVRMPGETPRAFLNRIKQTKYKRLVALTEKKTKELEEYQYRGERYKK